MSVLNTINCNKCDIMFSELNTLVKYDDYNAFVHNKCLGLLASELKC